MRALFWKFHLIKCYETGGERRETDREWEYLSEPCPHWSLCSAIQSRIKESKIPTKTDCTHISELSEPRQVQCFTNKDLESRHFIIVYLQAFLSLVFKSKKKAMIIGAQPTKPDEILRLTFCFFLANCIFCFLTVLIQAVVCETDQTAVPFRQSVAF